LALSPGALATSSRVSESLEAGAEVELEALEAVLRQRVEALGVGEAQRRAEHRQQDAQLDARGGAQAPEVERLALAENVAGVGEHHQAERPAQQEVVLQVELQEAVA